MGLVSFFFTAMRSVYGAARYKSSWPTEKDEQSAKMMWWRDICKFTQPEIIAKFTELKRCINQQERYLFPDVGVILSLDISVAKHEAKEGSYRQRCEAHGFNLNRNESTDSIHLDGREPEELAELRARPAPEIGSGWGRRASSDTGKAYMIINTLNAPGLLGPCKATPEEKSWAAGYVLHHWPVYCEEPMPADIEALCKGLVCA